MSGPTPRAGVDAVTAPAIEELLDRLERLVAQLDELPGGAGDTARDLAETLYLVHRSAVGHLADGLGDEEVERVRSWHPAIAWLFDVYQADLDDIVAGKDPPSAAEPPPGTRVLPIVRAGSAR